MSEARESQAGAGAWTEFVCTCDEALSRPLRALCKLLQRVDALRALGVLAREPGWTLPEMMIPTNDEEERPAFTLEHFAHPTLGGCAKAARDERRTEDEETFQDELVRNDWQLAQGHALVLTGPNMGGKSSLARGVALCAIFAQVGGPVFARRASLPAFDAIYTRMGAADDLAAGKSTFLTELERASRALRLASRRSLVILDELGRGTSTHDGVAVAGATLRHLVQSVRCSTIFITHYHDLAAHAHAQDPEHVENAHMAYARVANGKGGGGGGGGDGDGDGDEALSPDDDIVMLYSLKPGLASESFGLYAARVAGMPPEILHAAKVQALALRKKKE